MITTGLFAIEPEGLEPTAAWAEVQTDLMGNLVARLHTFDAEGLSRSDSSWSTDEFFVRTDRDIALAKALLFFEGEWHELGRVERSDDDTLDDLWCLDSADEAQLLGAFATVAGYPACGLGVQALDDELVEALDESSCSPEESVSAQLRLRGRLVVGPGHCS